MKTTLILKFPYSSNFGGGEQHTLAVFSAVAAAGGTFFFAGSCRVLLKEFRRRGWQFRRWHVGKEPVALWSVALFPLTFLFALPSLLVLLLRYRFGKRVRMVYCLSLTEKVVATPIARLLGMEVVWMEHVEGTSRRWLRLNPLRLPYVLWSRLARIVVLSEHVRASFRALGVPDRSLRVIYYGIDTSPFQDFHRSIAHWTRQFIIGSVGRLDPEKGYAYLLHAFQKLLAFLPQARLILAGDGPERRQLEWLARQLNVDRLVQFVGFQEHPAGWYKTFDCFVLPSTGREAFGIVLLEALAATCPVVATKVGGIPEVIAHGKTGLLVEPANVEALLQGILAVYQHPDVALQRATAGREMVAERFSHEAMVEQFLELFS